MSENPSRRSRIENVSLLVHTARNMQLRQLLGVADRKLRHLVVPALPVDFDARYERSIPDDLAANPRPIRQNTAQLRESLPPAVRTTYRDRLSDLPDGEVTFVNETLQVDGQTGIRWTDEQVLAQPILWLLKFHGFEFLSWAYLGTAEPDDHRAATDCIRTWIQDWDASPETDVGTDSYLRRSWTPHSVSLRLLNWVRYAAWYRARTRDEEFAALLVQLIAKNAAFLSNHVEYDVGGNHLIENGAGLSVAGLYLDHDPWVTQGLDVLSAATTQFRADGGHFEHSPMYHVLTLTRYLTVIDLLERTERAVPEAIRGVATDGVRYLQRLEPPDGRIPLLNDAVHGEVLPLRSCLGYADRVGIDAGPSTRLSNLERMTADSDRRASHLSTDGSGADSPPARAREGPGYYWLDTRDGRLLVDGGAVGPPHLPAHSHNDHFAVLLWVDGQQVLSDAGTTVYTPSDDRQYCRSVAAHNTVQYENLEPISMGGTYLLGRRFDATVRWDSTDERTVFDGRYRRADGAYSHRRRLLARDDWWLVYDDVDAREPGRVRSRLHLDPEVDVERTDGPSELSFVDATAGESLVRVYPLGDATVDVGTSAYFPEFGVERSRRKVTLSTRTPDTRVSVGWLLTTRPHEAVSLDDGDEPVLSLDGDSYRIPEL